MEREPIIRMADTKDINTLRLLAGAVWPVTYESILSPEQLSYMLELFYSADSLRKQMDRDVFLIVEVHDEPAGFASYSETKEPGVFKLHKLYVRTDIQGKGLGRSLIAYIIYDIKKNGATALDLNVNRLNKARAFYEKLGFQIIREEDIDIGKGFQMNDYVMRKLL